MSVTGIVSGVYGVGKTLGINLDGVFSTLGLGGATCSSEQKQARKDLKLAIEKLLTPGEMQQLVSGMEGRVPPNPEAMAYFYFGEKDCKHKNVGSRHQKFLDELPAKLKEKERQLQQEQQEGAFSGGGMAASIGSGLGFMPVLLLMLALGGLFITRNN